MILKKRAESQASVTATVIIEPNGVSNVEVFPSKGCSDTQLMKLSLLYVAKIRFVLSGEDPQIVEAYQGLMEEVVDPFNQYESSDFLQRLSSLVEMLEAPIEAPKATGSGERFVIRLIEGRIGDFIYNDLPFRGLAVNIPISVLLVIHAVAERVSKRSLEVFWLALGKLYEVIFNERKPRMFKVRKAALAVLEEAEAAVR